MASQYPPQVYERLQEIIDIHEFYSENFDAMDAELQALMFNDGLVEWEDVLDGVCLEATPKGKAELARWKFGKEPNSDATSIDKHMQQVAQAVGDDTAGRVLKIANSNKPGEERMRLIAKLDVRYRAKTSVQWGTLLGVSSAAVRGYSYWQALQEELKKPE